MIPQEIIRKKRDGGILSAQEIAGFFNGFLDGQVADYQVSAMLMAILLKGMTHEETASLTEVMRDSGEIFKWPFEKSSVVDKHSTGGIGDKTSIVLLPLCVLEGLKVPMIAGRGLGHTGGTLDKLEAIGVNVFLNPEQIRKQLDSIGGVFMGQTDTVARLDRRLYALRDVTATVESIPLIVGSILSKKLAEGIGHLVMDVKFGSGAFMQKYEDARNLAVWLKRVGEQCGVNMRCLLTDMGSPLGTYAGNALEIFECIEILQGKGPADTVELTLELVAEMVLLAHPHRKKEEVLKTLSSHLTSGAALEMFEKIVKAQGGNTELVKYPEKLISARIRESVTAEQDGYVGEIDTRSLGIAVIELGGGRLKVTDKIDFAVGLSNLKRVGFKIKKGDVIAELHGNDVEKVNRAIEIVKDSYKLQQQAPTTGNLIAERI